MEWTKIEQEIYDILYDEDLDIDTIIIKEKDKHIKLYITPTAQWSIDNEYGTIKEAKYEWIKFKQKIRKILKTEKFLKGYKITIHRRYGREFKIFK